MERKKISGEVLELKNAKHQQILVLSFSVFFLTIIPFLNSNKLIDPSLFSKFTGFTIGLLVFVLIFIFVPKFRKKTDLTVIREIIFPVYLVFIVISAFSIFNAVNVSEAFYDLIKNIIFFIFLVISAVLLTNTNKILHPVSKLISVFSSIIIIVGIIQFIEIIRIQSFSIEAAYGITGVFSHKNLFAQMLFLVLPFNIFGIYFFNKLWKVVSFANCVLIIFMIIATMARSVWVATVVAVIFTFVFKIIIDRKFFTATINIKLVKRVLLIVLTIIGSITIVVISISKTDTTYKKNTIGAHVSEIPKLESGNIFNRMAIWKGTIKMIGEYPVFGAGGGNWKILIPKYGVDREIVMPEKRRLQRPHNDFLWVLSENGILGFVSWFAILLIGLYYLTKIIKVTENREERIFYSLMLFALIGYSVFSFFSFPRERVEHNTYFHFIIAIAIAKHYLLFSKNTYQPVSKNKVLLISVPVILILLVAIYTGIKKINTEIHTKKVYEILYSNGHGSVINEIDLAHSWFSTIDPTSTPLLWYKGVALYAAGKTDEAISNFRSSLKTNPFHSGVFNGLGICYAKKGDLPKAKESLIKSTQLKPFSNEANINLGKMYLMENDEEKAIDEFYKASPENKDPTYRKYLLKDLKMRADSLINTFNSIDIRNAYNSANFQDWDIYFSYSSSYHNNYMFEQHYLKKFIKRLRKHQIFLNPTDKEKIINRANELQ